MKKKRFTEEQIAYALAQESMGQTIAAIFRKLGVSEQTVDMRARVRPDGARWRAFRNQSSPPAFLLPSRR